MNYCSKLETLALLADVRAVRLFSGKPLPVSALVSDKYKMSGIM